MKVKDLLSRSSGSQTIPIKEEKRVSSGKKPDFRTQFAKVEEENYKAHLDDLVDKITRQGERLGKKVDIAELRAYRTLISEFLHAVVGKSRKFTRHSLLDRRGRHRVYSIIKKINEELDALAEQVMKNESDNIEILKRINGIKGLILDMVL